MNSEADRIMDRLVRLADGLEIEPLEDPSDVSTMIRDIAGDFAMYFLVHGKPDVPRPKGVITGRSPYDAGSRRFVRK